MASNQTVGNIGLYYCCYKLSELGWNVLPTSRNARGIDIVAYAPDDKQYLKIQVKTLSKRSPVPLGENPRYSMADFVMICRLGSDGEPPSIFIMTPQAVDKARHEGSAAKSKSGKKSYWLQPSGYENSKNKWDLLPTCH